MSVFRLRIELEIDTTSKSTRVIDQHLMDGMATTQVAHPIARVGHASSRKCAWPACENVVCLTKNGRMPKFCGRDCYGKSRRGINFIEHHPDAGKPPRRQVIVDAVTGVIGPTKKSPTEKLSSLKSIDYSTFSFHEGVQSCASS